MNVNDDVLQLIHSLGIEHGDSVMVSSDMRRIAMLAFQNKQRFRPDDFINGLIDLLGENGTLLLPAFNWDFRKGIAFDYKTTPCMTGALGKAALERSDFIRTRHPIYSFAIYGRDKDMLFDMENVSSFGTDSPFGYLHKHSKGLVIDISFNDSLTFAHYVEEMIGVPYRDMRSFTAPYTGPEGIAETRTYTMYMRDLDKIIARTIDPIGEDLHRAGLLKQEYFSDIPFSVFSYSDFYDFAERDIRENRARKLCIYKGQED